MFEVKKFSLIPDSIPSFENIDICCKKATEEKCIVELTWYYCNAWYNVTIYPDEGSWDVYNRLPKVYGM